MHKSAQPVALFYPLAAKIAGLYTLVCCTIPNMYSKSGALKYRLAKSLKQSLILAGGLVLTAFVCSRFSLDGVFPPFGCALVLACELLSINPLFALLGLLLGCLFAAKIQWAVMATVAIFVLICIGLRILALKASSVVRLLLFTLLMLAVIPLQCKLNFIGIGYASLGILLSLGGSVAFVQSYKLFKSCTLTQGSAACYTCLLCMLICGMNDISFFGVSMPMLVMLLYSMLMIHASGLLGFCLSSLLVCAFTALAQSSLASAAVLLCGAVLSLPLKSYGKLQSIIGYFAAAIVFASWTFGEAHMVNLQNLVIASVLFLLIPAEVSRSVASALFEKPTRVGVSESASHTQRGHASEQLSITAEMVQELAAPLSVKDCIGEQGDPEAWAVSSARCICSECEAKVLCWIDPPATEAALINLLRSYKRGERVYLRPPIDSDCRYFPELVGCMYLVSAQAEAQLAGMERMSKRLSFAKRQLSGISELLFGTSERILTERWHDEQLETKLMKSLLSDGFNVRHAEVLYPSGSMLIRIAFNGFDPEHQRAAVKAAGKALNLSLSMIRSELRGTACIVELEPKPALDAVMAVASAPKHGGSVSGDSSGSCRLVNSRVVYALSDGMGSGESARRESDSAIALLFSLYRSGLSRELVLENVNRMLMSRRVAETYATLDAVSLDLETGQVELAKYGAPPSVLLRGGNPKVLFGEALPCGIIDEAKPSLTRFVMQNNDILVLCSDGVWDVIGTSIDSELMQGASKSAKSLAEGLLSKAQSMSRADDMTVMVIKVA